MSEFSAITDNTGLETDTTTQPARKSRKGIIIGASIGLIAVLGLGGSATAYSMHYADKALPRTVIAGQSVSGMNRDQITAVLSERTDHLQFEFAVANDKVKALPNEMGLSFDPTATADAALAPSATFFSRIAGLFSSHDVAPVSTLDATKFNAFADSLARKAGPVAQSAGIKLDASGDFVTTPAVTGKAVNIDSLTAAVDGITKTLTPTLITAEVSDVEPAISEEEAEAALPAARALLEHEISITDGIDVFAADRATRGSWIFAPESADRNSLETPIFNHEKVKAWVEKTAKDSDVAPKPTYNNVDASGKVLVEGAMPGKSGYKANNVQAMTDGIVEASKKGEPFAGEFKYDEVPAPVENRQVLPGAEGALYPAAAGEKWLEINLSNNSVTGYEGLNVVHGPIPIVPGEPGYETVTGLFHIYLKYEKQDMGCTPEWPYCAKDVPWVSYFHGSYAFHGAPWQSSFGWSGPGGSHGCVNMPVSEARWLHQWSEIGTPVVSHY